MVQLNCLMFYICLGQEEQEGQKDKENRERDRGGEERREKGIIHEHLHSSTISVDEPTLDQ